VSQADAFAVGSSRAWVTSDGRAIIQVWFGSSDGDGGAIDQERIRVHGGERGESSNWQGTVCMTWPRVPLLSRRVAGTVEWPSVGVPLVLAIVVHIITHSPSHVSSYVSYYSKHSPMSSQCL
jgi:hypothetical protein